MSYQGNTSVPYPGSYVGGSAYSCPVTGSQVIRYPPPVSRMVQPNQQYYQQAGATVVPMPAPQFSGHMIPSGSAAQYYESCTRPPISGTPPTQTNTVPPICATPLMETRTSHPNPTGQPPFSTTVTQPTSGVQYTVHNVQSQFQPYGTDFAGQSNRLGSYYTGPSVQQYPANRTPVNQPSTSSKPNDVPNPSQPHKPNGAHDTNRNTANTRQQPVTGTDFKLPQAPSSSGYGTSGNQSMLHHSVLKLSESKEQQNQHSHEKEQPPRQKTMTKAESAKTLSSSQVNKLKYILLHKPLKQAKLISSQTGLSISAAHRPFGRQLFLIWVATFSVCPVSICVGKFGEV